MFGRRELKESCGYFLDGLLSGIERKTAWMMAEQAGLERPWRIQALLGRSRWEADAMRDDVRSYVVEALGCASGVLVVNETGFLKKGRHSVGVGRQYSGGLDHCEARSRHGWHRHMTLAYDPDHGRRCVARQIGG